MNLEKIKNALDLAQMELRANYKTLNYRDSNVLTAVDEALKEVKAATDKGVSYISFGNNMCACAAPQVDTQAPMNYNSSTRIATYTCNNCRGVFSKPIDSVLGTVSASARNDG